MPTPSEFAQLQKLTPADAVAYLQQRGQLTTTYSWQDLWQQEHAHQFTISRLTRADLLQTIRDKITASVQGDLTRTDFMRDAKAALAQAGWWGEKEVIDPSTGETLTTQFNPARLKLIFDVNTRQAHAAGQWAGYQRSKATHPYLRYITRRDERVRDLHRQWDNVTLPVDDPFWKTHYPPNGWRCRCRVVAVSQREYDKGYSEYRAPYEYNPDGTLKSIPPVERTPFKKQAPKTEWKQWKNSRTDQIETIPVGIDPGFGYNPGIASIRARQIQTLIGEKLTTLNAQIGAQLWQDLYPHLQKARQLQWYDTLQEWQASKPRGRVAILSALHPDVLNWLKDNAKAIPTSAEIGIQDRLILGPKQARHAQAQNALTEEEWRSLPALLQAPGAVYYDNLNQKLVFVAETLGPIKVVVEFDPKKPERSGINIIRTAFRANDNVIAGAVKGGEWSVVKVPGK